MHLYKTKTGFFALYQNHAYQIKASSWSNLINTENLHQSLVDSCTQSLGDFDYILKQGIEAPIDMQEVWASGVTYIRSRNARMEESKDAGGDTFYDKVYEADRPELFFKATPNRVVGTEQPVRIRKDSTWDVPEPELTLFINSTGAIAGYTIGNDMSSRSIEGENPLYLPQAKTYEKCAGLGPCLYVPNGSIDPNALIVLEIYRSESQVFGGKIGIDQMKRKHQELVDFLTAECDFPAGVFLMTGTGIVPDHPFTLQSGDRIEISIEHIGTLINTVE